MDDEPMHMKHHWSNSMRTREELESYYMSIGFLFMYIVQFAWPFVQFVIKFNHKFLGFI